jgi:hypothetical protein
MDRLARYREFMRRLDVTDAAETIQKGLYVPPTGESVADRIVSTATLRPYASQVLVGGIGAGKTTQLLVARDRMKELGDTNVIYVDVGEHHRLERLIPGVLLAIAASEVGRLLPVEVREPGAPSKVGRAWEELEAWAHGQWYIPNDRDDGTWHERPEDAWLPGLLKPPPSLSGQIEICAEQLRVLRDALPEGHRHVVVLFDSLDRVEDVQHFVTLVEQDLRALRRIEVGVVMTAPLQAMFGSNRAELDRFDVVLHQPAVDVADGAAGRAFLRDVLRRRDPSDLLADEAIDGLSVLSGGVMRDLISLARGAAEEAYMRGADRIDASHVALAADRFGRKRMLGLDSADIEDLVALQRTKRFVPTTDRELALLVTRRILEYQEGQPRYVVHPTLVPLLKAKRSAA